MKKEEHCDVCGYKITGTAPVIRLNGYTFCGLGCYGKVVILKSKGGNNGK